MKRAPQPRKTAELSQSLQQRLNMYAFVAGAAGVGALALGQPVEAKIIYTPAHVRVVHPGIPLDLNHDGIVDFYIVIGPGASTSFLSVCQYIACNSHSGGTNSIRRVPPSGTNVWAAVLRYGARVQRGQFAKGWAGLGIVFDGNHTFKTYWFGPWANGGLGVKNRYLGLKFSIKGQFHFGWARLNVVLTRKPDFFDATLTGYAYETIPNKGIIAGKTQGPDVITVQPGSLGHLAAGAHAIPAGRSGK